MFESLADEPEYCYCYLMRRLVSKIRLLFLTSLDFRYMNDSVHTYLLAHVGM